MSTTIHSNVHVNFHQLDLLAIPELEFLGVFEYSTQSGARATAFQVNCTAGRFKVIKDQNNAYRTEFSSEFSQGLKNRILSIFLRSAELKPNSYLSNRFVLTNSITAQGTETVISYNGDQDDNLNQDNPCSRLYQIFVSIVGQISQVFEPVPTIAPATPGTRTATPTARTAPFTEGEDAMLDIDCSHGAVLMSNQRGYEGTITIRCGKLAFEKMMRQIEKTAVSGAFEVLEGSCGNGPERKFVRIEQRQVVEHNLEPDQIRRVHSALQKPHTVELNQSITGVNLTGNGGALFNNVFN